LKTYLRVGRYGLDLGFEETGIEALSKSMNGCEVTVVDEIGPMELKSSRLVEALYNLLEGPYPTLATVHHTARHPLIRMAVRKAGSNRYILDESNREKMPKILAELLETWAHRR